MSNRGFTDINSREYTPIPDYPRHDDDDVFNYFYILEYDMTVDPPTINWRFERKTKKRKVLGDLTREEASNRRRRVSDLLPSGRQNMDVVEENQMGTESRRRRRRRSSTPDLTEGIGMQQKSGNPWIQHVKAVARKHNISYQEALKSGKAKKSYMKGGTNIFNPIDGFKVGYKFGHDTLGPALFGKK